MNFSRKKGFTLLELLIAMFLFALIAALLIPKVTKDAEKQLFVTQLLSVQNDLQQAFLVMITRNQNDLAGFCSNNAFLAAESTCLTEKIGEYLATNVVFDNTDQDDPDATSSAKNPGYQKDEYIARQPQFIDKNATGYLIDLYNNNAFWAIYLKNGAFVSVRYSAACDTNQHDGFQTADPNGGATSPDVCGYLEIDVNAGKAPNMVGKDIHYFWIHHTDGLVPFGALDNYTCAATKQNRGNANNSLGCTAQVIDDRSITYY